MQDQDKVLAAMAGDFRALLAAPSECDRPRRPVEIRRMLAHLGLGLADAAQVVLIGSATHALLLAGLPLLNRWQVLGLGVLVAVFAALACRGLSAAVVPAATQSEFGVHRRAAAILLAVTATGAICLVVLAGPAEGRSALLAWFGTWAIASTAVAAMLGRVTHGLAEAWTGGQRIAVVGAPEEIEPLARCMAESSPARWRLDDRIDDRHPGGLEALAATIEHRGTDLVVLAISGAEAAERIAAVCARIADQPVRLCLAVDTAPVAHRPRGLACIGRYALVDLVRDPHGGLKGRAKRLMDILGAGLGLLLLSPILAAAALALRLESPGPVLFRQWRFGLGSRPILVLKFRSMRTDACDRSGARQTVARDPRVTRVGRILRRTSIDELPQLLNVLRGEMSLVGPRPHPLHMRVGNDYYFEAVPGYRARHLVKPGITGWAQVNGSRGEVDTLEKARRRVALDLWYLENWSLGLDLWIVLRTVLGGFASPRAD